MTRRLITAACLALCLAAPVQDTWAADPRVPEPLPFFTPGGADLFTGADSDVTTERPALPRGEVPVAVAAERRRLSAAISRIAIGEIGQKEEPAGSNSGAKVWKYTGGGSYAWCSSFATWVYRKAGIAVQNYPYSGELYEWGRKRGRASKNPHIGDLVFFGKPGPWPNSKHVGIVVGTLNSGKILTVEGNIGSGRVGYWKRWFKPKDRDVYGFVRPRRWS